LKVREFDGRLVTGGVEEIVGAAAVGQPSRAELADAVVNAGTVGGIFFTGRRCNAQDAEAEHAGHDEAHFLFYILIDFSEIDFRAY
jgi:hypothetical protein